MWINPGQEQHTLTAGNRQFDSGVLNAGGVFVVTVEGTDTLTYHCPLHPKMKGSIIVGKEGDSSRRTTEKISPAPAEPTGEALITDEKTIDVEGIVGNALLGLETGQKLARVDKRLLPAWFGSYLAPVRGYSGCCSLCLETGGPLIYEVA